MPDIIESSYSRMFLIQDMAAPNHVPEYEGLWRAGALSWAQGDVTIIWKPSSTAYGKFDTAGKVPGEPGNPELVVGARYTEDLSQLLKLVAGGCDHDLQVHFGKCQDPRDFNRGWDKVLVLEGARLSDYGTEDLGALEPSQRAAVNEEVTFTGETAYEIKRITFAKKAETQVTREVIDIQICDSASCGSCGVSSDGCNIILAVTVSAGASPGLPSTVVWSKDGGLTWATTTIDTLSVAEAPSGSACVGTNFVVISNDSNSLHYAATADILNAIEVWVEVTTGFVVTGEPNAIFSLGPTYTWVVGDGGYIYFSEDITSGVDVQDAGVATTENLKAVHAFNENEVVAVGENNAVVHTSNGGVTWEAITGPAVGVDLSAVWMATESIWFVGTGAGSGKLYYTIDSGTNWVEKPFPGSTGLGTVTDIKFSSKSVGYMSHKTAANSGRILRTIDGGNSWYVAPEGTGSIPTNQGINAITVCPDVNKVFGGGVTVVAGDGIIVAGA